MVVHVPKKIHADLVGGGEVILDKICLEKKLPKTCLKDQMTMILSSLVAGGTKVGLMK